MIKHILLILTLGSFMAHAQEVLTPEKMMALKRVGGGTISPDGKFLLFSQTSIDVEQNKGNTDLFVMTIADKSIKQITNTPVSEASAQWVDGNKIYFLAPEKDQAVIWRVDVDGANKTQISENVEGIEDFKITKDASKIIVLKSVEIRKNINQTYTDLPKANARVENDLMYRHWASWDDYTVKHIFYYPLNNGKISGEGKDLLKDEKFNAVVPPFGDLGGVTFTPDNQSVIYSSKKKSGKEFALSTNSELYQVELETGKTICLTDSNEFKGYESHPAFSIKGDLAWLAMKRDGFESDKNNLMVKTANGKITNLTENYDITISDFAWNGDGTRIFVLVPTRGTVQIFEINLKSGALSQITSEVCDYTSLSVFGNTIYAGRQSMISPTELYSVNVLKSNKLGHHIVTQQLTDVNSVVLKSLAKPTVQEKWVKTTDGKDMLVWMILPPNFDATKKYPTLLYCQGGPQSEVSQFFSYRWNFMVMASQGYVVVAPNRRGLPGFGQEWNDAISKDWGGQSINDYLSAIDAAAELPYVDKDRLGAVGASYGGYSVYMLAGVHQKRFKTFIAHCGLFNLESWYGMTEELFFATWDVGGPYWQQENKEAFLKNSPHRYVQNWDTPIMVIHGGMDFRVPESEGMQAYQVAQLKGLKSRFLYFPTEGHWVTKPQNALVWHREFYKWLAEDLKPELNK
ncbi:MAG: S9 family peptidase [Crocinitomicaceae bacterium]